MDISVRGLSFDVVVSGPRADAAPVLLLHGFPQNSLMWDQVVALLHSHGRDTVTMDQRGYSPGARPAEVDAYRISECVADVVAVTDSLGLREVDLVGHDWGAMVAWHLAAERPERFRTLTALAVPHPAAFGAAVATDDDQKRRSSYFQLFRQEGKAEQLLLEDDGARLRAMFDGCPAGRVDRYVTPLFEPGALTAALNWYRAMGPSLPCAEIMVPTTYVWGERDTAVGATAARSCGQYVTGEYEFVSLDASHWMADEVPEQVSEIILDRAKG